MGINDAYRSFKLRLATSEEIKSDWKKNPWLLKALIQSDISHLLSVLLVKIWICLHQCVKDALDHHHHHRLHPHLLPNVVFVVKRGIFILFFVRFYTLTLLLCWWEKKRKTLEQKVERHKKTNSRQLRMSDYCKMTN